MKKILIILFLSLTLFLFIPKAKATTNDVLDINSKMVVLSEKANYKYCYNYLSKFKKSEIYHNFYNYLFEVSNEFMVSDINYEFNNISNMYSETEYDIVLNYNDFLDDSQYLTTAEINTLLYLFHWDNPIFYWMHPYYLSVNYYTTPEESLVLINVNKDYDEIHERTQINAEIYQEINRYLSLVEGVESPYTKARIFQKEIALNLTYEYVNGEYSNRVYAHNILGLFKYKWGVCETYAQTFQLLLNLSGVECIQVHGQKHAWNMAKMNDDQWYFFDVTNDDLDNPNSPVTYAEFCTVSESFLNNHKPYDEYNSNLTSGKYFKIPSHATNSDNVSEFYTYKYEGVTYKIYYDKMIPIKKDNESSKLQKTIEFYNETYTVMCLHQNKVESNNCYTCEMCLEELHTIKSQKEKQPTCTEDGVTSGRYCSTCNKIFSGLEVIDKLGHIESEWIIDVLATKNNAGHQYKECMECGEILVEEIIPKLGGDKFNYIYLIPIFCALFIISGTVVFVIKKKK